MQITQQYIYNYDEYSGQYRQRMKVLYTLSTIKLSSQNKSLPDRTLGSDQTDFE